ncbi:NUDIX hydrolase [Roseomonas elaeocarpi]|uniref:NUDIX hydrolase n=1 Tax=Roseomonas elaeocarpi TaxID=907779 RepID=A0ABV6JR82_9PROT
MTNKLKKRLGRQYAALPYAEVDGEMRVMLVTSRETHRWVLPKGWAEKDLAPHELAAKEAFEEAGLLGAVSDRSIGSYHYNKRLRSGREIPCDVAVFPLRVERQVKNWPERRERETRWFTPAQAALEVEEAELVTLLLGLAVPAS